MIFQGGSGPPVPFGSAQVHTHRFARAFTACLLKVVDIIHGWAINKVIFPKSCKERHSLLSTFLWIIKEDNSCVFTADEQ